MKKSFICCILLLSLYVSLFAAAQEDITITPTSTIQDPQTVVDNPDQTNPETTNEPTFLSSEEKQNPQEIIKDATSAAKDSVDQGIKIYDESVELTVPSFLEKPTQFLFHTNAEKISLNFFLILIILFCMLFMILNDIVKEMFDSKLIHNGVAFILTFIASLLGVLYNFTKVITSFVNTVSLGANQILQSIILTIIIVLFYLFFKYGMHFIHGIKQESKEEAAYKKGKEMSTIQHVSHERLKKYQ